MVLDWLFGDDGLTDADRRRIDNALCTWRAGLAHEIGLVYHEEGLEALAAHAHTPEVADFWRDDAEYGDWSSYAAETLVQSAELAGMFDEMFPKAARLDLLSYGFVDDADDPVTRDRVVMFAHYGEIADLAGRPAEALTGAARELTTRPMLDAMDRAWELLRDGASVADACREAQLTTEPVPPLPDSPSGADASEHADWFQTRARRLSRGLPTHPAFDGKTWLWTGDAESDDVAFYRRLADLDDDTLADAVADDRLAEATSEQFASEFERRLLADRDEASPSFDERILRRCWHADFSFSRVAPGLAEIATVEDALLDADG